MFNLANYRWSYGDRRVVYFVSGQDALLSASDILARMAAGAPSLFYNYFSVVSVQRVIGDAGLYIELPFIPEVEGLVHPVALAFRENNFVKPTFKITSYMSADSVYEEFKNTPDTFQIKHYPLRGQGLYHTLANMNTLGVKKSDFIVDAPFNIVDYEKFDEYFGYNKHHGGGGHTGSCTYVIGESGMLPTGIHRTIS